MLASDEIGVVARAVAGMHSVKAHWRIGGLMRVFHRDRPFRQRVAMNRFWAAKVAICCPAPAFCVSVVTERLSDGEKKKMKLKQLVERYFALPRPRAAVTIETKRGLMENWLKQTMIRQMS